MNDTISITDLKQNTAGVIARVKGSPDPILVLQRSEVAAVLVDPVRYREMEALIERLEDMEDIQAIKDRKNDPTISAEQMAQELGL